MMQINLFLGENKRVLRASAQFTLSVVSDRRNREERKTVPLNTNRLWLKTPTSASQTLLFTHSGLGLSHLVTADQRHLHVILALPKLPGVGWNKLIQTLSSSRTKKLWGNGGRLVSQWTSSWWIVSFSYDSQRYRRTPSGPAQLF